MGKNNSSIAKFAWLLCVMLVSGSCQWAKPKMQDPAHLELSSGGSTHADSSALTAPANIVEFTEDTARLRDELIMRDLDITKLTADLDYHKKRNQHLELLCKNLQQDLTQAEKQFISIEKRLQLKESKASAVSALAEAKLAYNRFQPNSNMSFDPQLLAEIDQKLAESAQLIQIENYTAAVYYAKRALRMLERSANTHEYIRRDGERRVVSVARANLRSGPGLDHDVIAHLAFGTVLVQVEKANDWSKIEAPNGVTGWIHYKLIR
ncbi:MAG: SH3 domain-containing protein [Candidatus Latescibacterota bacterium]